MKKSIHILLFVLTALAQIAYGNSVSGWEKLNCTSVSDLVKDARGNLYCISEENVLYSSDSGESWEEISTKDAPVYRPYDLEYYEPSNALFIAGAGGVMAYDIDDKSFHEVYSWGWDPTRSVSTMEVAESGNILMAAAISSWGSKSGVTLYELDSTSYKAVIPDLFLPMYENGKFREIEFLASPGFVCLDPDSSLRVYAKGYLRSRWGSYKTKPLSEWKSYTDSSFISNWSVLSHEDLSRLEKINRLPLTFTSGAFVTSVLTLDLDAEYRTGYGAQEYTDRSAKSLREFIIHDRGRKYRTQLKTDAYAPQALVISDDYLYVEISGQLYRGYIGEYLSGDFYLPEIQVNILSPAGVDTTQAPILKWHSINGSPDDYRYELVLSDDSIDVSYDGMFYDVRYKAWSKLISDLNDSVYTAMELEENTHYFWRVRAYCKNNASQWSDPGHFYTGQSFPSDSQSLTIIIDSVQTYAGQEVRIPLVIHTSDSGLIRLDAFQFSIAYDEAKLNLLELEWNQQIEAEQVLCNSRTEEGWFACVYADKELGFDHNSILATCVFRTKVADEHSTTCIHFSEHPAQPEFSYMAKKIDTELINGRLSILPDPVHEISSLLEYHQSAVPIKNTRIDLGDDKQILLSDITNEQGRVRFHNLKKGRYSLKANPVLPWGGVTARDLLLMKKQILGLIHFDGLTQAAANVSGDAELTAMDVKLVANRIVGKTNSFAIPDFLQDTSSIWVEDDVDHVLSVLASGDCNASYFDDSSKKTACSIIIPGESILEPEADDTIISIPFYSQNDIVDFASATLKMGYQPDILEFENLIFHNIPSQDNVFSFCEHGMLNVVVASAKPVDINKGSEIFRINFRIKDREELVKRNLNFSTYYSEFGDFEDQPVHATISYPLVKSKLISGAAIPKTDALSIKLYPNPATSRINISSNHMIRGLCILDRMGTVVADYEFHTTDYCLGLSGFDAGLYLFRIRTADGLTLHKVVIK